MEIETLVERLQAIDRSADASWRRGLCSRKVEELEFHDRREDRGGSGGDDGAEAAAETRQGPAANKKHYDHTAASQSYLDAWIAAHVRDRVVLDYACGDGSSTLKCARAGARLAIGIDISGVSVATATRRAAAEGLERRAVFIQGDCENTRLPDASIEVMLCFGMLHHLDLSYALPEMRRLLAPGGKVLAFEALDYNPLFKLYRRLTPELRTAWEKEHILSLDDLRFARRFFEVGEVKFWHITSVLSSYLKPLAPAFEAVDRVLTRIPGIRLLSWIFTFEMTRRAER